MACLRLFALLAGLLCTAAGNLFAADNYPAHPIRWIVSYPPGGTTDLLARIMGQSLTQRLGQHIIIDNRPGAGNNIGTELAVKAAPDGYTMFLVNPANAINATLYQKLPFDFLRDMEPVAGLIRVPNVMTVTKNFPAKNVREFIDYAKKNPGKVKMASSGSGTSVQAPSRAMRGGVRTAPASWRAQASRGASPEFAIAVPEPAREAIIAV